jgi:hypothetical protein
MPLQLADSFILKQACKCRRLARTGPAGPVLRCLLMGVDQKSRVRRQADANDPERTSGGSIYAVSRWLPGRKVLDCTHRKKGVGAHGRRGLRSCGGCMEARQKAHSIVARNRIPLARPCFARDSDRPVFLAGRAPGRSGVHLFGRTCPVVPCN